MARICSFEIHFKKQSFPTLVSVVNRDTEVECTVHYVQRKIRYLAMGDKLVYCKVKGLKQPQGMPMELSQELNRCIRESVLITIPAEA